MANVYFAPAGATLAAYLTGEIDHHSAQTLRREIDAQIDARLPESVSYTHLTLPTMRTV